MRNFANSWGFLLDFGNKTTKNRLSGTTLCHPWRNFQGQGRHVLGSWRGRRPELGAHGQAEPRSVESVGCFKPLQPRVVMAR